MDGFKDLFREFYISFRENNLQHLIHEISSNFLFICKRVSIPNGEDEFGNDILKNTVLINKDMLQQMIFRLIEKVTSAPAKQLLLQD